MAAIYEITVRVRAETAEVAKLAVTRVIEDQIDSGRARSAGVTYASVGVRKQKEYH